VIPIRWPYRPGMNRGRSKRTGIVLAITGVAFALAIGGVLIFGGEHSAANLGKVPSALVLNSAYAKSVGYSKTV